MSVIDKDLISRYSNPVDSSAILIGGSVGYIGQSIWTVLPNFDASQAGVIGSIALLVIVQTLVALRRWARSNSRTAWRPRKIAKAVEYLEKSGEESTAEYLRDAIELSKAGFLTRSQLQAATGKALGAYRYLGDPSSTVPLEEFEARYLKVLRGLTRADRVEDATELRGAYTIYLKGGLSKELMAQLLKGAEDYLVGVDAGTLDGGDSNVRGLLASQLEKTEDRILQLEKQAEGYENELSKRGETIARALRADAQRLRSIATTLEDFSKRGKVQSRFADNHSSFLSAYHQNLALAADVLDDEEVSREVKVLIDGSEVTYWDYGRPPPPLMLEDTDEGRLRQCDWIARRICTGLNAAERELLESAYRYSNEESSEIRDRRLSLS